MRVPIALLFLQALTAGAQVPLPLYERWDERSLLISRDLSQFDSLDRSIDTVTALGPKGREFLRVTGTRVEKVDECCNPQDPEFLLLELERPVVKEERYTAFFAGTVNVAPWPADTVDLRDLWSDTLVITDAEGPGTQYFFAPDSISGDGLTVRRHDRYTGAPYDRTYATPRRNCIARSDGVLASVRCARDTSLRAMVWGANMHFLFDHGTPVLQFYDWSGTSTDGYGPFAHSYYEVCGVLPQAGSAAYVLTSGEVVHLDGERWTTAAREPVLYYGECDCPEDE